MAAPSVAHPFSLLSEKAQAPARELGFREPTPPQTAGIPRILAGEDVLIIAPTGSGKTEAALLPRLGRLPAGGRQGKRSRRPPRDVRHVIVDEVHQLVQDRRGAQLAVGLERLREATPQPFQRIGLSATVGDPPAVARFFGGPKPLGIVESVRGEGGG